MRDFITYALGFLYSKLIAFGVAIVLPVEQQLWFVGFLICIDTFFGVMAARKRGEDIDSNRMGREGVYPKLLIYPSAIILGSVCEHFFPAIPFVNTATFILMAVELKSLEESWSEMLGIKFIKYIKLMITKGRTGVIDAMIDERIAKKDGEK